VYFAAINLSLLPLDLSASFGTRYFNVSRRAVAFNGVGGSLR
jgi:hypothetical protein